MSQRKLCGSMRAVRNNGALTVAVDTDRSSLR